MNPIAHFKRHVEQTLLQDTEYRVSLTPKTAFRNFKRYFRFKLKTYLPPTIVEQLRFFLWNLYFTYHYFRPAHLLQFLKFTIKKERYIALYGGFGDLLMILPFFKEYAEKNKDNRLILVYNDVRLNKFKETSYWPPLQFKLSSGKEFVPIKDFLSNLPYFYKIIPGDIWDNGYDCWHAPHIAKRLKGCFFKPQEYKESFQYVFSQEDLSFAESFYKQKQLQDYFIITLHFRTSVEQIKHLYNLISNNSEMKLHCRFLLLGNLNPGIQSEQFIDLRNNYEKGINIRQLLAIAKKSNLYLGGRGGFDLFFWLAEVPTINIFDLQGKGELEKMWPRSLWEENYFKDLYWQDTCNPDLIFKEKIFPYFKKWLNEEKK